MKEKLKTIINTIRANKQLPPLEDISDSLPLRNGLGFDSFDLAELTVNIEEEFGVDVFADSIPSTLGDLCNKLENR